MCLLRGSNEKYTIPSVKCSCQKTLLIKRSIHRTYGAEKLSNNTRGVRSAKSRIRRMMTTNGLVSSIKKSQGLGAGRERNLKIKRDLRDFNQL